MHFTVTYRLQTKKLIKNCLHNFHRFFYIKNFKFNVKVFNESSPIGIHGFGGAVFD